MTERTIDAERAGGTDAKPRSLAAPEMSIDEALQYHGKFEWKTRPTKSDQARAALVAEVEHVRRDCAEACRLAERLAGEVDAANSEVEQLRLQQANLQKICRIENSEVRRLIDEVERFSSALPGIIGCADGDPTACTNDPPGYWAPCCRVRRRCVASGLLPPVEMAADQEDGA